MCQFYIKLTTHDYKLLNEMNINKIETISISSKFNIEISLKRIENMYMKYKLSTMNQKV